MMASTEILKDIFGDTVKIERLTGGDINEVYKVKNGDQETVVKLNVAEDFPKMFKKEKSGLELLSEGPVRVPKVINLHHTSTHQLLEIEYIQSGIKASKFWENFGHRLAGLHQMTNNKFGLSEDNYIGSLKQQNDFCSSWDEFLVKQRLMPMIKLAVDNQVISYQQSKQFEPFFKRITEIYPFEKPSLLHGDLWSGNFLVDDSGSPVIIDPAVYYGHREIDIGMMNLFGGFENELFNSYNEIYPLEKDWQKRIGYNQLYPLMVHVNLFGLSYWSQVERNLRAFQ